MSLEAIFNVIKVVYTLVLVPQEIFRVLSGQREWSISIEDYSIGWNILFLDILLKLECFSRGMFYGFVAEHREFSVKKL
ncbi:hypothetical protein E2P63_05640 [Candidatus Bathyarchaeota archaeon]|nr:hypothetical protein E2P63_05640 [Candidatus Bathyarchaeota archaeon]